MRRSRLAYALSRARFLSAPPSWTAAVLCLLPLAAGATARADSSPPPVTDVPQELGASAVLDGLAATSVAAGHYGAEHSVTAQGAFTYRIPIQAPPARGGFAPSLSLVYSSMAEDGLAGMGWSLNGIPSIHRVQGTYGINYDGLDTYAANFGAWGTPADPRGVLAGFGDGTLHTKEDTNAQYVPSGACGDGPCFWTMRDGSGTTYVFGSPTMKAPPTPKKGTAVPALWELDNGAGAGKRGIFLWSLASMTDAHGNTISFTYVDPTGAGAELVPTRIVYSTHATQAVSQSNEIDIAYEPRTDVTLPPYRFDVRPTTIDVRVASQLVRRYALTYEPSPVSERSLLHSLQLLGSDGSTAEQPTVFTYNLGHNLASGNRPPRTSRTRSLPPAVSYSSATSTATA